MGSAFPEGWVTVDADLDGHNWHPAYYNNIVHERCNCHGEPYHYALSASYIHSVGALTPDNYLYLPAFTLRENTDYTFGFSYAPQDPDHPGDQFAVYITEYDPETDTWSDLTQLGNTYIGAPKIQRAELDLSAYAGKQVKLAFRHFNSSNEFYITIDCLTLYASCPTITAGGAQSWTPGTEAGLEVVSSAHVDDFLKVQVNDQVLDSTLYTVTTGSTKVTLKPEYLNSLAPGEYRISIVSKNGGASSTFTIAEKAKPNPPATNDPDMPGQNTPDTSNPDTGDTGNLLWAGLLLLSATVLTLTAAKRCKNP